MSSADIDELLPLTPASFHILLVLAAGAAHGYAIMVEVDRITSGSVHLGPGTLYRTIQKLIDDGLIAASGSDTDERRVPYAMTRRGWAVARAESARLASLVAVARKRGLLGGAGKPVHP